MKKKAERRRGEVFWLFLCQPVMGFFTGTTETRSDEHLFHMMRFHMAAIPTGAASFFTRLILLLIEKEAIFFFFLPSVGVKWIIRAQQNRKAHRDTQAEVMWDFIYSMIHLSTRLGALKCVCLRRRTVRGNRKRQRVCVCYSASVKAA